MNVYKPEGALLCTKRNVEYTSTVAGLTRAMERGVTLEGMVILCDHDLTLHVSLPAGIRAIIPKDEAVFSTAGDEAKDIAILTRVGKPVCFKVTEIRLQDGGSPLAVLSRKKAQRECYESYTSRLIPGDVISARVTHIEGFGAFVDIGCGIISLLPIDSISVSRISHPMERLGVGDLIFAVIKSRDELGRLNISMRELLGTWLQNAELFCEGETVGGIVRSVESYGIFVELSPNLAGLAEYRDGVRTGQAAAVYIKSIIPEKMKIKLIIIDTRDSEYDKAPINYFIDTSEVRHIDSWVYSPSNSKRIIESIF